MTGALQHRHLPTLQRSSLLENRRTVSAVEPVPDTARRILTHRQLWRNWQNCFNTLFKEQKMNIRKAKPEDLSRIAEIYVFNNRINYYPIFQTPEYSFGELQVVSVIDNYFKKDKILHIRVRRRRNQRLPSDYRYRDLQIICWTVFPERRSRKTASPVRCGRIWCRSFMGAGEKYKGDCIL